MGGDHGPSVTIPAVLSFLRREPHAHLFLVGQQDIIIHQLKRLKAFGNPRLSIVHASEIVEMDDTLTVALRTKKDSSMRVAVNLVKEGQVQACVSAGNTAALMAISRYVLKTMEGIDRPAICALLPNQKSGPTYMLDVGANVDCTPDHLYQFAIMGAAFVATVEGKSSPTVGLLNIGQEEIKGNELVKSTAQLFRDGHQLGLFNFYGNVEGNDIFEGTTDIVVCDGFVGNVALKAAEGMGRFVKVSLTQALKSSFLSKLGVILARSAIKAFSSRMNPSRYNGATLLGLRGLIFKSHGSADVYAFEWAIRRAHDAVKCNVFERISKAIAGLIPKASINSAAHTDEQPSQE